MKPISRKRDAKKAISKQAIRDETERLVKEALEAQNPYSYAVRSVKSRLSRSRGGPDAIQV
jgi:hypothetical protein